MRGSFVRSHEMRSCILHAIGGVLGQVEPKHATPPVPGEVAYSGTCFAVDMRPSTG
jgi:hypothetical protein